MKSRENDIKVSGEVKVSIPGECLRVAEEGGPKEEVLLDRQKPKKKAAKKRRNHNKELGRRGEEAAARFLSRRGYTILERNWSCDAGEADIIVRDDDCLVFVEVKTRMDEDRGLPEEAVGSEKRQRYERIAAAYLRNVEMDEMQVRFDVIGILVLGSDRALIRHHINAFGVC